MFGVLDFHCWKIIWKVPSPDVIISCSTRAYSNLMTQFSQESRTGNFEICFAIICLQLLLKVLQNTRLVFNKQAFTNFHSCKNLC